MHWYVLELVICPGHHLFSQSGWSFGALQLAVQVQEKWSAGY